MCCGLSHTIGRIVARQCRHPQPVPLPIHISQCSALDVRHVAQGQQLQHFEHEQRGQQVAYHRPVRGGCTFELRHDVLVGGSRGRLAVAAVDSDRRARVVGLVHIAIELRQSAGDQRLSQRVEVVEPDTRTTGERGTGEREDSAGKSATGGELPRVAVMGGWVCVRVRVSESECESVWLTTSIRCECWLV